MQNSSDLDQIDRNILKVLGKNGRITVTELAKIVGLSKTPCQIRLKRLIKDDFIQGFKARLNPAKMGLEHVAFVEVKMSNTNEDALLAFNSAVLEIPEVEQCHMIAGNFDYLLKIRTPDILCYRKVLAESVSGLPYVASTSTHVSMQSVKDEIS
ncbi:Lrp/AsnC family transcriptional regulator [Leisingera sp. ANG59]|uniref:Lrp/AsnC family transcriptional regulator n=1 Tax=Leisingera sp. ANG59 TaxID=2675221 RepID=UPI0015734DD2|nr:Lrp/AsnC ligand binding domain-containing protein [Leisingera sp. ANG59]NSY40398.1 winged helix-turn-helix transcriptional regulator [Leisingera sp. ANG59]